MELIGRVVAESEDDSSEGLSSSSDESEEESGGEGGADLLSPLTPIARLPAVPARKRTQSLQVDDHVGVLLRSSRRWKGLAKVQLDVYSAVRALLRGRCCARRGGRTAHSCSRIERTRQRLADTRALSLSLACSLLSRPPQIRSLIVGPSGLSGGGSDSETTPLQTWHLERRAKAANEARCAICALSGVQTIVEVLAEHGGASLSLALSLLAASL